MYIKFRYDNEEVPPHMGILMAIAGIIISVIKIYVVLSIFTSTIKSVSGNCSHTIVAEKILNGGYFCPGDR